MDRRTFLLATATTILCPSIALAGRRRVKCRRSRWICSHVFKIICIENGQIVNTNFLFENISYERAAIGSDHSYFTREVHAWLNEPTIIGYAEGEGKRIIGGEKIDFYGEVLVKQWGAKGCWDVATWIERLPESKIK
jgi:hypothetical protein